MEIILRNVRLSFPALYKPVAVGDSEPAFGAKFILDPKSEDVAKLREVIEEVARNQWKDKAETVLKSLKNDKRVCLSEGEYLNKDGTPYDGYEGMFHVNSRSAKMKPTVKNKSNVTVDEGDPGAPYNGCYVHAALDIWAQDNKYGRRINATLQGVMFAKDGPAFSGGRPATDTTFADLATPEGEEDFV